MPLIHQKKHSTLFLTLLCLCGVTTVSANDDTPALYKQHCAECHGEDRLGKVGPALLPQNLKRLRKKAAAR